MQQALLFCHNKAGLSMGSRTGGMSRRWESAWLIVPRMLPGWQARIALVNTALTAGGMWALAIPGIGLLSLFVFICSFIPIAGVFISTAPIAFVALTEYGFLKARAARPFPVGMSKGWEAWGQQRLGKDAWRP